MAMARICIIGASTAGLPCAYELRDALGRGHDITIVSETDYFQFIPSNPWVAIGWRERRDVTFPLAPCLKKKGISLVAEPAMAIAPDKDTVITTKGSHVPYDYLVIATGAHLAFEEVQGLGPDGYTSSICTVSHAEDAHKRYLEFLKDPGPVAIGAAQGASCFGPAYEFAFMLDADLRKRRLRKRVPIAFVTSEPYIGHLGLSGVGDSKALLEHEFRERHISYHVNAKIKRAEKERLFIEVLGEGEKEVPFKYSMIIPAFKGVKAVSSVEGLCNPRGFVLVDEFQRSKKYKNIFAAGVSIAIAPIEQTPVATGVPKTGYMIESMVAAIVKNIDSLIKGEAPAARATWNAVCLADMGDTGIAFVALPQIPPRDVTWAKKGKWVHYAKAVFEKYFIWKMKKGKSEPFYERLVFNAFNIKRLEESLR
jgi:sulfide:quinone oxidoreductase